MYTFLGMVRVDFTNDQTGELIQGWNLWVAEPAEAPSVGLRPTKKWLSNEKAASIFDPLGGVSACGKLAGSPVDLQVGLRGQVMGLNFPPRK